MADRGPVTEVRSPQICLFRNTSTNCCPAGAGWLESSLAGWDLRRKEAMTGLISPAYNGRKRWYNCMSITLWFHSLFTTAVYANSTFHEKLHGACIFIYWFYIFNKQNETTDHHLFLSNLHGSDRKIKQLVPMLWTKLCNNCTIILNRHIYGNPTLMTRTLLHTYLTQLGSRD